MPRLMVIIAARVFAVNVWADELAKSNSLTIDKDSNTGNWTATCDISVSGVDGRQIYSGRMLFQCAAESAGSATTVFDVVGWWTPC